MQVCAAQLEANEVGDAGQAEMRGPGIPEAEGCQERRERYRGEGRRGQFSGGGKRRVTGRTEAPAAPLCAPV